LDIIPSIRHWFKKNKKITNNSMMIYEESSIVDGLAVMAIVPNIDVKKA